MASVLCQKSYGALRPADERAEEEFRKIKAGDLVMVDVKRPRNLAFHRKYFGLLDLVLNALPEGTYGNVDQLHEGLKLALGYRTPIKLLDGTDAYLPGSISFAKMSQAEFERFYDDVCNFLCKNFLPGVKPGNLKSQLSEMLGVPPDLER